MPTPTHIIQLGTTAMGWEYDFCNEFGRAASTIKAAMLGYGARRISRNRKKFAKLLDAREQRDWLDFQRALDEACEYKRAAEEEVKLMMERAEERKHKREQAEKRIADMLKRARAEDEYYQQHFAKTYC